MDDNAARVHAMSRRFQLFLDSPAPDTSAVVQNFTWSDTDKSANFEIFPDKRICKRIVNRRGNGLGVYDCIRGSTGISSGLHIWEIEWIPMDGNLFPSCTWIPRDTPGRRLNGALNNPAEWIIGVATREAALDSQLFSSPIGMDKESWGWNITNRQTLHNCNGTTIRNGLSEYPQNSVFGSRKNFMNFIHQKTLKVVLDMELGTLAFVANDMYVGVAFTCLHDLTLYPILITNADDNCEVKIRYVNGQIASLKEMSRSVIRKAIYTASNNKCDGRKRKLFEEEVAEKRVIRRIDALKIPETLKHYIMRHI